ncbi:hypothetical protein E5163_14125 [Marinicauda algicola]|uniref:Homoserine dehydrogenase n=1 Tax=Marinicauda algicola TaxID=2029849 RepID=A0A4V3RXT5_9PROT|nr:hypothetical protein [Marinicauda algicola]TGY87569.1 hypothetical protein E5163_14125 [Marinicauda algicola]
MTALSPARTAPPARTRSGLMRAVLFGHGTVGGGVAAALPAGVRLDGVVVRSRRSGLPRSVPVFTAPDEALALKPDLVIEALPGGAQAEAVLERAVALGCHVVSANKEVCARRPDLAARAREQGTAFLCSAAVGGGVPVLETVERLAHGGQGLSRVRGVLNGTSNFVLDRLADGERLDDAIAAAQAAGFAEADPGADLDGRDAACKLALIARTAWGVDLDPAAIPARSIRDLPAGLPAKAAREGRRVRQVAALARAGDGVHAGVRLEVLDLDDPLSRARLEGNCVVLTPETGTPLILSGKGAGRVPTAASMLADIARLVAERCR